MRITNAELVREYHNSIKTEYPHITYEQCYEATIEPFKQLKVSMESGELATYRMKYLGTFFVYPRRAKTGLVALTKLFKKHEIDAKVYFEIKNHIEKYLEHVVSNNHGKTREAALPQS
jgi:hypothetical protein